MTTGDSSVSTDSPVNNGEPQPAQLHFAEPRFAQPERSRILLPALGALALLILAVLVAIHFFPATTVNIAHVRTDLLPITTKFSSDSLLVGRAETHTTLFVASTIRVENKLRVPIFLDDFAATYTDPQGAELAVESATVKELAALESVYPALKPLTKHPLLRETSIAPGQSAEGVVLLSFPFTKAVWDARKTAVITVKLYHQQTLYQEIPKP